MNDKSSQALEQFLRLKNNGCGINACGSSSELNGSISINGEYIGNSKFVISDKGSCFTLTLMDDNMEHYLGNVIFWSSFIEFSFCNKELQFTLQNNKKVSIN